MTLVLSSNVFITTSHNKSCNSMPKNSMPKNDYFAVFDIVYENARQIDHLFCSPRDLGSIVFSLKLALSGHMKVTNDDEIFGLPWRRRIHPLIHFCQKSDKWKMFPWFRVEQKLFVFSFYFFPKVHFRLFKSKNTIYEYAIM